MAELVRQSRTVDLMREQMLATIMTPRPTVADAKADDALATSIQYFNVTGGATVIKTVDDVRVDVDKRSELAVQRYQDVLVKCADAKHVDPQTCVLCKPLRDLYLAQIDSNAKTTAALSSMIDIVTKLQAV